jgi:choline dehydrogenase-like flavoprotein
VARRAVDQAERGVRRPTDYWASAPATASNGARGDVVIVGSGIAGAITGYTLARSGVSVLILEAGPRVDRAKATVLFRNSPTKGPELAVPGQSHGAAARGRHIGAYYVQAGPVTFRGLQARVVGGTTWHWGGLTLRYRPNDSCSSRNSASASTGRSRTTDLRALVR